MYSHEELLRAVREAGRDGQTFSIKDVRMQLGFATRDKRELSRFRRRLRAFERAAQDELEKLGNNSYRLKGSTPPPSGVPGARAQDEAAPPARASGSELHSEALADSAENAEPARSPAEHLDNVLPFPPKGKRREAAIAKPPSVPNGQADEVDGLTEARTPRPHATTAVQPLSAARQAPCDEPGPGDHAAPEHELPTHEHDPAVTAETLVVQEPPVAAQPTVTQETPVAAQPTVTQETPIAVRPNRPSESTVATEPSAATESTVATEPSATTEPSAAAEPSATAEPADGAAPAASEPRLITGSPKPTTEVTPAAARTARETPSKTRPGAAASLAARLRARLPRVSVFDALHVLDIGSAIGHRGREPRAKLRQQLLACLRNEPIRRRTLARMRRWADTWHPRSAQLRERISARLHAWRERVYSRRTTV